LGAAFGDEAKHLQLALGERLEFERCPATGRRAAGEAVEQAPSDLWSQQGVAGHDRADAARELLGRGALEQEAGRAGSYGICDAASIRAKRKRRPSQCDR
jgi:hypothetical protein